MDLTPLIHSVISNRKIMHLLKESKIGAARLLTRLLLDLTGFFAIITLPQTLAPPLRMTGGFISKRRINATL
jgi:hypothetical protein